MACFVSAQTAYFAQINSKTFTHPVPGAENVKKLKIFQDFS